jgi:serine/threonine protein kinase
VSDESDKFLELIAAIIADGRAVDWDYVASLAKTEADRNAVQKLRVVAAIRATQSADGPDPDEPPVAAPAAPVAPFAPDSPRTPSLRRRGARDAGKNWGKLKILDRVGEGAFGEVYRALDPDLDREVALKLLWPTSGPADAARQRALREARTLASINHRHVARIYGMDVHDGRIGVWLEFIRGLDLGRLMEVQGRFSASEAMLVGLQVCEALAAVHAAGFVHCDIKAHNVMREEGGRIVLTDFGAAHALDAMSHSIGGTPLYIAPEMLHGARASVQTDVYAVGVLLFKLATDTYPFHGTSIDDLREAHSNDLRRRAAEERPDLPRGFCDLLERALSTHPGMRFRTPGELGNSLAHELASIHHPPAPPAMPTPVITATAPMDSKVGVFVSYCHADARDIERLRLISHLKGLDGEDCDVWTDQNIRTGDDWNAVLLERLQQSRILVPLVTQAYLQSRYCQEVEIKNFWTRRINEGVVIFPLIVAPCDWQRFHWLSATQFLPRTGTIMTTFKDRGKRDALMVDVVRELRSIVARLNGNDSGQAAD